MINVLPQKEKLGLRREYRLRLATVCFCIITFMSVFACLLLLPPYVLSSSKESSLESQLALINKTTPDISLSDLNMFVGKINTTLDLFENKNPARDIYKNVLAPVVASRPNTITISQFIFAEKGKDNGATLELHGVAEDRTALQSFKTNLEKTGKFVSVDVPVSNFVKRTNIDFTISLFMK